MNKGTLYALGAYGLWGFLPIYWKLLGGVPPLEILAHRVVWALLILLGLLAYKQRWVWLGAVRHKRRTLLTFLATAVLLSTNWFVFIWAIAQGFIVEGSLGYFINPLINVLFGAVFLGERLRSWQKVAILLALSGVLWLTISYGSPPWIALTLAVSFGFVWTATQNGRIRVAGGVEPGDDASLHPRSGLSALFGGYGNLFIWTCISFAEYFVGTDGCGNGRSSSSFCGWGAASDPNYTRHFAISGPHWSIPHWCLSLQ